jgi:hypothetical protein
VPQAVPYIASAAASAGGATVLQASIIALAASVVIGGMQQSSAAARQRRAAQNALRQRNITLRSAVAPRTVALGTVRTSGPLMYAEFVGAGEDYLDSIVAINHGEVGELVGVYIGDEYIAASNISATFPTTGKYSAGSLDPDTVEETFAVTAANSVTLTNTPEAGSIRYIVQSTGSGQDLQQTPLTLASVVGNVVTWSGAAVTGNVIVAYASLAATRRPLRVQWALGSPTQATTTWGAISTPRWTSNHRLQGVAYVRTLKLIDHPLFLAGNGEDVGAVIRGPKGVWDPRTSTSLNYSSNPALLAAWYRTLPVADGGLGVPSGWIDWPSVSAAANVCDELITVRKLDGSGYETVKRYECNTRLSLDQPPLDNLQIILDCMAGDFPFTAGLYRCMAGAFRSATVTLTDDDVAISDPINFQPAATASAAPANVVTASFYDAARNWVEQQARAVTNSSYVTADGAEEILELDLQGVTDERQANYLMGVRLERQRPALAGTLTATGKGADIALLDTVQLSLTGYSALAGKTFEVRRRTNQWNGRYPLELREIKSSSFALDADRFTAAAAVSPPANSVLFDVAAVTGVASSEVYSLLPDGTRVNRLRVTWTQHSQAYVRDRGQIVLRWRVPGGAWVYEPPAPGGATVIETAALPIGAVVAAELQAVNGAGATGPWAAVPAVVATGGTVSAEASASGVSVTGLTGSPFGSTTTVVTATFVARYTGKAKLRFFGTGTHATAGSGTTGVDDYATCRTSIWINSTRQTSSSVLCTDNQVGFGVTTKFPLVYGQTFSVTAGVTYTVEVRAQKLSSTATLTVDNINLQVEMI